MNSHESHPKKLTEDYKRWQTELKSCSSLQGRLRHQNMMPSDGETRSQTMSVLMGSCITKGLSQVEQKTVLASDAQDYCCVRGRWRYMSPEATCISVTHWTSRSFLQRTKALPQTWQAFWPLFQSTPLPRCHKGNTYTGK